MKMNDKRLILKISRTWSFNEKVSKVFDFHVKQSIPLYDKFHKLSAEIAEFYCKKDSLVYDLGCSTGKFINEISKNIEKIEIVGIDNSKKMVQLAKKKTAKVKKNKIDFICDDIFNVKLKRSNFIFCSLLLPFLSQNKQKMLIKKIYKSLEYGGAVIFLNKSVSKYSNLENVYNQLYSDFKLKQGISESDILKKTKSLRSVHTLNTSDYDIELLKTIGFNKIDIFFKYLNFTGFIIEK